MPQWRLSPTIICLCRGLVCKWPSHTFPVGIYGANSCCRRAKFKSQIHIDRMDERRVCATVIPLWHWGNEGRERQRKVFYGFFNPITVGRTYSLLIISRQTTIKRCKIASGASSRLRLFHRWFYLTYSITSDYNDHYCKILLFVLSLFFFLFCSVCLMEQKLLLQLLQIQASGN